jgi:fructose 1,6-bisphosphate aldolase/phosphatase
MKITLSVIKADIGSIGGHIRPSTRVRQTVEDYIRQHGKQLLIDTYVSSTGDDIAVLMSHQNGVDNPKIHELAWNAFMAGTAVAKEQGLYGAGQDLLKDAFSGNVRGLGPASCEMEFDERPNEPFVFFAADKTDPGAYNLPLYLGFADPMYCAGLLLSPAIAKGYRFTIMDVSYTEGDRIIELRAPEELYDIACLLRDNERFVVESVHSRATDDIAAVVSTSRLHNIAGKYTGKDDPVAMVRLQGNFPATGEILSPYRLAHYVAGTMRGSHNGPLMPVKLNSGVSFFDGPPVVSAAGFCVHNGKFTEVVDLFDHPFWDWVRNNASQKAAEIRMQGFSGPAMLPYSELEYGGVVEKMGQLDKRFAVRKTAAAASGNGRKKKAA